MATVTRNRLHRRLRREGLVLVALLALWPWAAGCVGLFRPATAQSPEESGDTVNIPLDYGEPIESEVSGVWQVPTLSTMAAGIGAKGLGNGKDAYIGGFADDATFDFDASAEYSGNWNLDLEKNFYSYFVGLRSEGYLMRWSYADAPGDDITPGLGTGNIYRKYEVYTVTDGTTNVRIAVGIAHLFLRKIDASRWAIVHWEDHVDPAVGHPPTTNNPEDLSMSARRLEQ
jgi:hypothetical protein